MPKPGSGRYANMPHINGVVGSMKQPCQRELTREELVQIELEKRAAFFKVELPTKPEPTLELVAVRHCERGAGRVTHKFVVVRPASRAGRAAQMAEFRPRIRGTLSLNR